ncbi:TonB-dependent receptor domain-containing protein [Parerythrobacter lacustris]|uniref:TonB-dependent receptor n=1 Tax=Parerythrobacter lacustris TaxID=2969984 RepID=A0ABT1XT80_9SPHN|nr:TonB-dependent receptor [Parerythrobacter lacustris]MCR2834850.1 TonB-dependent receptor [Parerythrobacter lacustris]
MSNRFTKASLLAGTVMAGAMVSQPVYAQDDAGASEDDFIVVTGSRIARRVNVETAAPIAVVDSEEFELSGTVNVENVINTLPQVVPGFTSNSNNPGTGTATLNLRGLGATRTMVLVNGRRWMFYDTGQIVDLNTIPSFLLDSVDVVTGGASAVYGSDALSGVVNFRLKSVQGVELGAQYSITERGDGDRYGMHGAIGTEFDDGRGSVTVYAEYYNRSSVFQSDRGFSREALGDGATSLIPLGSSTTPDGRFNVATNFTVANGTGPGTTLPAGAGLLIDNGLFLTPGVLSNGTGLSYNYAPANYLQIPQERYLLGGFADYEFQDGHTFYTEVSFVNNRVAQELAATPVTGSFNFNLATIQPFLSAAAFQELVTYDQRETAANAARIANGLTPLYSGAAAAALQPGVINAFFQRRVTETGSRNTLDERNAFRVLGGVRGEITDWLNYDAYYMYARTRNANVQAGNISRSAFQRGLDGSGPAINVFGPNTLTPAMVEQISILAQNGDISTLEVANASVSGFLGNLGWGGGDIGFAIGAEYRKQGSEFIPDTALSSGDVIGFNAGQATAGAYNAKEVFAELNIPILGPDSGIERLELTGAARYSDYSLDAVGGVWTYAGGIEFAPIPDITLRGQYQRAIRAPNVATLFGGQSIGFPPAQDPCGTAGVTPTSAIGQFCISNGVPAGAVGSGLALQLGNSQIPALFGGNPNLSEETSDSWTVGVVLEPSFIPGLTVTADWFDIVIDDAISALGGGLQNALNVCFQQVQDANAGICSPFFPNGAGSTVRNGSGSITVDNPPLISNANIAELGVAGLDVQMNYSTTIPFSLLTDTGEQDFNVSFLGTYTHDSYFIPIVGLPDVNECEGRFGLTCGEPTPKWKWTSRFTFIDGPLTTSVRWRHVSGVDDDDDATDFIVERLPAADYLDLTFSFEANEHLTLSMGVSNIFDKAPPVIGSNQEQANTYPGTYDVIGRDFFASARVKF